MKMRAAVLRTIAPDRPYARTRPISVEEVELQAPQAGEVMVKIAGAGLCHSDLSVIDGSRPRPLPVALGHDGAGTVVVVGAGVRGLAPADTVVLPFSPSPWRWIARASGRD